MQSQPFSAIEDEGPAEPALQVSDINEQVSAVLNYANQCKTVVTGMNAQTSTVAQSITQSVELLKKIETNINKCIEKCKTHSLKSAKVSQESLLKESEHQKMQKELKDEHTKRMSEQEANLNEARNIVTKERDELKNNLEQATKKAQEIEENAKKGKEATDRQMQDLNNALEKVRSDYENTTESLNQLREENEKIKSSLETRIKELETELKNCNSTKLNQGLLDILGKQYQEFQNLESLNTEGLETAISDINKQIVNLNKISEDCENCDKLPGEGYHVAVKQPGKGERDDITRKHHPPVEIQPSIGTTSRNIGKDKKGGNRKQKKGGFMYLKTKKKLLKKNKDNKKTHRRR